MVVPAFTTSPTVWLSLVLLWTTTARSTSTEYGLTGFPANSYDPVCATACLRSLNTLTLDCSSEGVTVGMQTFTTSTECYAQNTPFLTSVAWCAHTRCAGVDPSASLLEYWWDMQVTGQKAAGVAAVRAKWTYGQALSQVQEAPTLQLTATDTLLNRTSLASSSVYKAQYNVLYSTQREGTLENKYGISMLVIGFGLPVLLTGLAYLPVVSNLISKLRPFVVWPSTFGTRHVQSLPYLLGKPPVIGQALYIFVFFVLNVVFTAVGYQSNQPNAWNPTVHAEIMSYIIGRTGTLAYITMPLIWLFAGRNNVLLWMSNWSHSTFMTLHRWVARIYTVQVLLHSIVALAKYQQTGMYSMEVAKPYWVWGIVATLAVVILCFGSGLYVRSFYYQRFVAVHVVLSVLVIVGCWYHAYDLYGMLGGYGYWMYATAAVWAVDRVGRLLRICVAGICRARVTEIGGEDGYARVDAPGIRWSHGPGMHAYLYFPTLTPLTPWENHPFSVMPTVMLRPSYHRGKVGGEEPIEDRSLSEHTDATPDIEKSKPDVQTTQRYCSSLEPGLTFFVKKTLGFTKLLRSGQNVLTLVEGPYPNNSSSQVLNCDRLLLLGGGIGITSLVPFIASHHNVKLCWSVKETARCLVNEVDDVLQQVHDKDVNVGKRLDIRSLLATESETGWQKVGVVVAGPPQMCDDARAAITAEARRCRSVEFVMEIEAYSW